jgi:hypothetical protein
MASLSFYRKCITVAFLQVVTILPLRLLIPMINCRYQSTMLAHSVCTQRHLSPTTLSTLILSPTKICRTSSSESLPAPPCPWRKCYAIELGVMGWRQSEYSSKGGITLIWIFARVSGKVSYNENVNRSQSDGLNNARRHDQRPLAFWNWYELINKSVSGNLLLYTGRLLIFKLQWQYV